MATDDADVGIEDNSCDLNMPIFPFVKIETMEENEIITCVEEMNPIDHIKAQDKLVESEKRINQACESKSSTRQHQCSFCFKEFSQLSKLIVHERAHTIEKPNQSAFEKKCVRSGERKLADKTVKLIDLVRKCSFLYDTHHSDYKNVAKKAEAWRDIAEKLHQSRDVVKVKWKNLRDSYVKYLKYLNGSSGSENKFKNWPWATHLEFLHDTVSPPTVSYIQQLYQTRATHVDDDSNENGCVTDDSQMPPTPKKFKRNEASADVDPVFNYLENDSQSRNSLDGIDHLFLSYAETFKKFPPRTQVVLKIEMAKMFGLAELRDMDSQTPPPTSTFLDSP